MMRQRVYTTPHGEEHHQCLLLPGLEHSILRRRCPQPTRTICGRQL